MRSLEHVEADLLREIEALKTKACEKSLAEFTRQAWEVIEPGTPLVWNFHMEVICAYLEATTTMNPERRITRLIINVPPGSAKSILVSVMFPAWLWIKQPHKKIIGVANIQDLSIRDSRRTKQILQDEWYQKRWPLEFKGDQTAKTNYENAKGGFRQSLGITANITGKRGNYLLLDDLHDASDVQSDVQRQTVLDAFDEKLSTRLNHQAVDVIILIMQRLHHKDITGHLLSKKKTKWTHVVIPMHYDPAYTYNATKDLGRPDLEDPRKEGELLFPEMFPKEVVEKLEEDMGSHISAGQLEQRPSVKGGGILRQGWFRVWDKNEPLPVCDHIFISCDTAYSERDLKNNSYSAFTTWGVFWNKAQERDCILLLDVWYDRVDYPDLRRKATDMDKDKRPDVWLIEKKASGQCHDDKTEVLTSNGWKLFKDVDINKDKFATRNIETKELEWQYATAEVNEYYKGPMYHFQQAYTDLMVTPNHRMLLNREYLPKDVNIQELHTQNECVVLAKDLAPAIAVVNKHDLLYYENPVVRDKRLPRKEHKRISFPIRSNWVGEELSDTVVVLDKEYTISGNTYAELIGMCMIKHKYRFRTIDMSESLASIVNIANTTGISLPSIEEVIYIPSDIMEATPKQIELFWRMLSKPWDWVEYHDTDKYRIDQLQELLHKMGVNARITEYMHDNTLMFKINITYDDRTNPRLVNTIDYKGTIHCVQVPNGTLYTRRDGAASWSGNSLVQDMRRAGIHVRTYQPDKDKITRAYSVQAMLESGQVWIPDRKWAHKFAYLMSTFPKGVVESNDLADTLTQALIYMRNSWYVTHPDDGEWEVPKVRKHSPYGGHLGDQDERTYNSLDGIDPRDLLN